jgi:hypothetical protein
MSTSLVVLTDRLDSPFIDLEYMVQSSLNFYKKETHKDV